MKTWILVADQARARLFERDSARAALRERADYAHPEGQMSTAELQPHLAARSQDSGGPSRHAIEPHTDPHDKVAQQFARRLAQVLREGVLGGDCADLVLVAPARFLGQLRAELDPAVAAKVSASLDKDLTRADSERLRAALDAGD